MFKRCLICTDFTDGLQKLVYFVSSLAKGGLEEIIFFHAVPLWEEGEVPRIDQDKINEVKKLFSPALQNIPSRVTVKVEVLSGEPLNTIPKIAQENSSDVILVATPLRNVLQDRFFGSTSMGLAKSLDIPLMIFRPQLISVYTEAELDIRCQHLSRSLLIPYFDGETGHYLIEQIKHYASHRPENSLSKCTLLSVVEDISRSKILAEHHFKEAEAKLNEVKTGLEALGLQVKAVVRKGKPLTETLQVAYEEDISAIAIATDGGQGLLEWTMPSFAQEMLHRSWFPLLFFTKKN